VEVDLLDCYVIHKPPGWEVDTVDVGSANHLSSFVQSILNCTIATNLSHAYGILHRLDTPSSGLILAAKSFQAYYSLKFQLNVGEMVREYVVFCHGLLCTSVTEIKARVYQCAHDGNLPSTVDRKGKPSTTYLKLLGNSMNNQEWSCVSIRIRTGRRHQIRTHTQYIGHPTVCDGKYTPAVCFLQDQAWCEEPHRVAGAQNSLTHTGERPTDWKLPFDRSQKIRLLADCP